MNSSPIPVVPPHKPVPRLLYPMLIVAALTVTLFSLLGIASMTGSLPSALAEGASAAAEQLAPRPPGRALTPSERAPVSCADCGVIDAINPLESRVTRGTGLGAILGGVTGAVLGNRMGSGNGRTAMTLIGGGAGAYAGNEIEKRMDRHTVWVTHVRMTDGTVRQVTTVTAPVLVVGSRVRIVGGQLVPRA